MIDVHGDGEDLIVVLRDIIKMAGSPLPDDLREFRVMMPDDAALYLGLSTHALRWHRCRRSGPAFVRFGNRVGYRAEDLDRWIAARRVEPEKPALSRGRPAKRG